MVTVCTIRFNVQHSTFCPQNSLHESHNKQRLFLYTALNDWFGRNAVFTERYGLTLKMQIRLILVFKSSPIPCQSMWDL
jgi:hypothetical protein